MVFNSHIFVDEIYFFNLLSQIFFGIKNPNTSAKNDPPAANQKPMKSHIANKPVVISKLYQAISKYTKPVIPRADAKSPNINISNATATAHASERNAKIIHNAFGIPKSDMTRDIKQNPATANMAIIKIKKIVSPPDPMLSW